MFSILNIYCTTRTNWAFGRGEHYVYIHEWWRGSCFSLSLSMLTAHDGYIHDVRNSPMMEIATSVFIK
jgi:hypothetical protein